MSRLSSILRHWLPLAVVILAAGGMVYIEAQQAYRMNANDPQIQLAEDGAAALAQGTMPEVVAPPVKIDVASSLAPFVMVFDDTGNVLTSSGLLNGQNPALPQGVLDYTRTHGEDRVTWTPQAGLRIAAVVTRAGGSQPGFVLAGRSLREAEKRIDQTGMRVTTALLTSLFASLIMVALVEIALNPQKRRA